MPPLSTFPLPLSQGTPPPGYGWEERSISDLSTTSAFATRINERDKFLGRNRCIICGMPHSYTLEHCHIIMKSDPELWTELRTYGWIPRQAKTHPEHEPRNGLYMCQLHHSAFDAYRFFIRFYPDIRKFVFVNYSEDEFLRQHHGKTIALDVRHRHTPFPSLFIIHELRVRGFHPFKPTQPDIGDGIPWQDWILSDGVLMDNTSNNYFNRDSPPPNGEGAALGQPRVLFQPGTTPTGGGSSGGRTLALNDNVIADILAATRELPSWKACQMEGMGWSGTAEENIQKYVSAFDVQGP